MRQYELRCKTSFERGVARFNKHAQDRVKGAGKRVAGRDGSGAEGGETYGRGDGGDPPANFGRGDGGDPVRRAELRAWRGARTKSGGGAVDRGRKVRRPTVTGTAATSGCPRPAPN